MDKTSIGNAGSGVVAFSPVGAMALGIGGLSDIERDAISSSASARQCGLLLGLATRNLAED